MDLNLTVTDAAKEHFRRLIQKENVPDMNIRISVENPGTIHANIGVTFCPSGEEEPSDKTVKFEGEDFILYVEEASIEALEKANLDYEDDEAGGQLSITAPNLKGRKPANDSPLKERVRYVLDSEINPGLAGHGGRVSLVDILEGKLGKENEEGKIVILRFGGGCQGCGMVNVTLKHGIEKTLKEKFPEIAEIRDSTDHELGENPYYSAATASSSAVSCEG